MAPTKFILTLTIILGASTLLGATPVHAASRQCDDQLIELGAMQAALTQMEQSVADGRIHREQLRTEASTLAAKIADEFRRGATELDVESLIERRDAVLRELAQSETLLPVLEGQLEALQIEVDHAERGYIACVEATLE